LSAAAPQQHCCCTAVAQMQRSCSTAATLLQHCCCTHGAEMLATFVVAMMVLAVAVVAVIFSPLTHHQRSSYPKQYSSPAATLFKL